MPSSNVERFITSFMQAIQGCGPITEATYMPERRLTHVTHNDGCVLDIPDEVTSAMSPEQVRAAFGHLSAATAVATAIRTGNAPTPPPLEDLTAVWDQTRVRRVLESPNRAETSFESSNYYGAVAALPRARRTERAVQTTRGQKFISLLGTCGITLPTALNGLVGQVLNHMYGDMEERVARATERQRRLEDDYRSQINQANTAVAGYKASAEKAAADAAKLEKLREAAIAWRDTAADGEKPVEKFAKFNALMNAIDATPAQAPEAPDLTVELPAAELVVPAELADSQPF
jgi:hypothetical protein